MHIKTVILDGFKSFGRPTEIPFYQDFTVITGPNGSGKSNIIDAVLFALGLARTRGIRAEKLTDLIYNPGHAGESDGDTSGPREATVTVVLDNQEKTLDRTQVVNAAGTESVGSVESIRVKRRVKQTSDNYYSYYYLNGRSCNLSDIQDLLAQAGITPEGYNVVMQGDVTEIINMTPYQRRGIIDEIAGVAEFDAKKDDAFVELDAVEERIEEADLRIEEKTDRLAQLEDERETALAYQELKQERAKYEGYLKAAELEEKRHSLNEAEEKADEMRAAVEEATSTVEQRRRHTSRLEAELRDLTTEIERKGEDEQLRIKAEIEEIKGEIDRHENAITTAQERIAAAEDERREAFVKLDQKQETVEQLTDDIRSVKVEKASTQSDLNRLESELAEVEAEIAEVDTEYDELKSELATAKQRRETLKTARNDCQRKKDRLLDETRRRASSITEAEETIEHKRELLPDLETELSDLQAERETAATNLQTIKDAVEKLRHDKQAKLDELEAIKEQIQAKQSEYASLEARASDDGDVSWPRAVTTILRADRKGVHGTVGQLGTVTSEYATACETAAGSRLAQVVVDDDEVGSTCIEYLKQRNAGRATFLPITKMDDRGLSRLPNRPGVVDFARNLVEYDTQYAGIFSYVLGSTLVVESMETARSLMGDYRMVTLDGDLVERSGAMTGGSGSGTRFSFSKSGNGRLERIATEIASLEDDRQQLQDVIRDLEGDIDDARDRLTSARDRRREIEAKISRVNERIDDVKSEIESAEETIDRLRRKRASVDEEMQELDTELTELDRDIETVTQKIETLETELADSAIPELTAEADRLSEEIASKQSQMNDLDGRVSELRLKKEYAEDAIEELESTIENAQTRKADAEETIEYNEAAIERRESRLESKYTAIEELESELTELKGERQGLQEALTAVKERQTEAQETLERRQSRFDSITEKIEELNHEISTLEAEVGDYDPTAIPEHETVEAEIERLNTEMSALEPVNMLAIDEYDSVADALAELKERRDILVEERSAIEKRIEQFEAQKKETFMRAYEAINTNFTDIFERLSDGTGELHLENPDDPFDAGLTMKAQPGDKPIQRLAAMSGGEKSLTALAFIFAIQRHKPAPFYALDEVDAFLDAANAERVGEMVDNLASDAQFVVVSHRSALLERSERAVGVTMQGDNVSAVTGIQLGDADTDRATADD